MCGCGEDSAVQSHSMGGVSGGERRDTHTQGFPKGGFCEGGKSQ